MISTAISIVRKLKDHNFIAVFAGGCVRDQLLGIVPKDIDIVTNALPDQIEHLFDHTIPLGKSFGVITVIENNFQFEVATFRRDGVYEDNRHPSTIEFCDDMVEDAKRRDFTINGLFYDPITDTYYDYVGGADDIDEKIICFIGDATDRIHEDSLRMLRAIRFAVKFNFVIIGESLIAIHDNAHLISNISKERVRDELIKIFRCKDIERAIVLLEITGLLKLLLPEIHQLQNCRQDPIFHPEGHVLIHTIKVLENIKLNNEYDNDDIIIWSALFHDVGKPQTLTVDNNGRIRNKGHDYVGAKITYDILRRLKFSNDFIETVCNIVKDHMTIKFVSQMKKSTLKKYLSKSYIDKLIVVSKADSEASGFKDRYIDPIKFYNEHIGQYSKQSVKPKNFINGRDLIEMGYKPGVLFSRILSEVYDQQLNDIIMSKDQALIYVKENYKLPS